MFKLNFLKVNCKLSGMPDLALHFGNVNILDDVGFHPCVRNGRWEQNKVISFVPPDGKFQLMTYRYKQLVFLKTDFKFLVFRVKGQLLLPIYVNPQISFNETGGKVTIVTGTKGVPSSLNRIIDNVIITIPFSKSIGTALFSTNQGTISFDEITKVLVCLSDDQIFNS
jgi:AP-3 complex subunit mu